MVWWVSKSWRLSLGLPLSGPEFAASLLAALAFPSSLSLQVPSRPSERVQWAWWEPGQLEIVSHLMRTAMP